MSSEFPVAVPVKAPAVEVVLTPELEALPQESPPPVLSPEQARAAEAIFIQQAQDRESNQVLGLLGMWTGTLLLRDLAIEAFSGPEEEEEEQLRKKRGDEGQAKE